MVLIVDVLLQHGEPTRPWTTLVADVSEDLILATDLSGSPARDPFGRPDRTRQVFPTGLATDLYFKAAQVANRRSIS